MFTDTQTGNYQVPFEKSRIRSVGRPVWYYLPTTLDRWRSLDLFLFIYSGFSLTKISLEKDRVHHTKMNRIEIRSESFQLPEETRILLTLIRNIKSGYFSFHFFFSGILFLINTRVWDHVQKKKKHYTSPLTVTQLQIYCLSIIISNIRSRSSWRSRILHHKIEWKKKYQTRPRITEISWRGPRILSPRKGRGDTPRHEIRGIFTLTLTLDSVPRGGSKTPHAHVHLCTRSQYIQRHPREKENIFVDARSSERCYAPITHVYWLNAITMR